MLLDTNIVIYAANPQYPQLLDLIGEPDSAVSLISFVEALGFHGLTAAERATPERFFGAMEVLPISPDVAREAGGCASNGR